MVWSYPKIELEEMVKTIKGFVDIMILASGYQSSGLPAIWDSHTIKQAFQWAFFFETVLGDMSSSGVYEDSIKELDAALSVITSDPSFPQGLANLSSETLIKARSFVLVNLLHALPLRDSHLKHFLKAVVEMDLDKLTDTDHDSLSAYLNKLTLQNRSSDKASSFGTEDNPASTSSGMNADQNLTMLTFQEILDRQSAVSCISMIEGCLTVLTDANRLSTLTKSDNSFKQQLEHDQPCASVRKEESAIGIITWNNWKSKNLCYFLDKKTITLLSSASLVFSVPKIQWTKVLQQLNASADNDEDCLLQTLELLLVGSIGEKWSSKLEHFMSVSYESVSMSKLYRDVCTLLQRGLWNLPSEKDGDNVKKQESDILNYLTGLLDGRLRMLWKLPPVLVAAAIPLWSPLFRFYVSEMEALFKDKSAATRSRWCNCKADAKVHQECEIAERIWCLYIFHVYGSTPNAFGQ